MNDISQSKKMNRLLRSSSPALSPLPLRSPALPLRRSLQPDGQRFRFLELLLAQEVLKVFILFSTAKTSLYGQKLE